MVRLSKAVLAVMLVGLLVLAVVVAISKVYSRTSDAALQLSSQIMEGIGEVVIQQTNHIFTEAEAQLEVNAVVAASLAVNNSTILNAQHEWQRLLWKQLQLHSHINALYMADRHGNFIQARKDPQLATRVIQRQGAQATEFTVVRDANFKPIAHLQEATTFDPRERPWFIGSGDQPRTVWSDMYRFSTSQTVGVSVSRPFFDKQGNKLGVFAADITLEGLSDFLSGQAFGQLDMAVILNEKQELVAYPIRLKLAGDGQDAVQAGEQLPTLSMVSEEHAWLMSAWSLHNADGQRPHQDHTDYDSQNFEHEGERYVSVMFEFPEQFNADWRLLLVAPEEDLLGGINRSIKENLTVTIIILLLFLAILYLLFGKYLPRRGGEK